MGGGRRGRREPAVPQRGRHGAKLFSLYMNDLILTTALGGYHSRFRNEKTEVQTGELETSLLSPGALCGKPEAAAALAAGFCHPQAPGDRPPPPLAWLLPGAFFLPTPRGRLASVGTEAGDLGVLRGLLPGGWGLGAARRTAAQTRSSRFLHRAHTPVPRPVASGDGPASSSAPLPGLLPRRRGGSPGRLSYPETFAQGPGVLRPGALSSCSSTASAPRPPPLRSGPSSPTFTKGTSSPGGHSTHTPRPHSEALVP